MADKAADMYIVDLGASMANCSQGRSENNLEWGMRYVWDKITTTVAASRKTWNIGVLGLQTQETQNLLADQKLEGYDGISVLQPLGPMTSNSVRELQPKIRPTEGGSSTDEGDAISAIVVAIEMINLFTRKLKYNRKIFLVTDATAPIDQDSIPEVAAKMNESNIQLVVIGVDFDDPDYGFKEMNKPRLKADNEKILASLVKKCNNGIIGTMAQAVEELAHPRIRQVRPYKAYDGFLSLGNPAQSEGSMKIPVERYFKTKTAAPPIATTILMKTESSADTGGEAMEASSEITLPSFGSIKQMRTYKVEDPAAPGGKRDVEAKSLARGYQYGRTAVHISESEQNITKLESVKSFTILGFIHSNRYEPFLNMGDVGAIVARRGDVEASLAFSSFINALYELDSYAVARYVAKDNIKPLLMLLMPNPRLEDELECLYDVPLPFAEDIRDFQFPPLDKVLTVSGTVLTKHRLLPPAELTQAMSDFVDAMDLANFNTGDDGQPEQFCLIEENYNPTIYYINQAIRDRALDAESPIRPPPPIISRYAQPPDELIGKARSEIETLIESARVKQVPPKAKGRRQKEAIKPVSGLDVEALLGAAQPITTISADNAIPEFKQALQRSAGDDAALEDIVKQMGAIVRDLIQNSLGDLHYDQATEDVRVMRDELIDRGRAELFNQFIRDLKTWVLSGELDGDRREMWWKIRTHKLDLVTEEGA